MLFPYSIFALSQASSTRSWLVGSFPFRITSLTRHPGCLGWPFLLFPGALEAQSVLEQVFLDGSESVSGVPRAQIVVHSHIPSLASCLSQIMETLLITIRRF